MPFSDPKFPIIDPQPTVDQCVKSTRGTDVLKVFGVTGASWVYGYIAGKPTRFNSANTAATIGFGFVTILILQDMRGRFMGYKENAREVKMYGMHPVQVPKYPPQDPRFPVATGHVSQVRKPHDYQKYS
jgi:hypothetical protein